ncbi:MAG: hypothetical protein PHH59_09725 [Methylovulum sp.]|uniref:hypothetical protein n=1 Tax=Methylovulum sp. TaxID=1916980 RepID=UPI002620C453|nr:hypothetical protein [Methylovulum sp.]MDD2724284.1 hypothetical protein [Methylovulum sp.]MDD5122983.1 hypothetical protein [Methylovulum sp.]
MPNNPLSERLIFGPSHSVRLKHALATRQLPELSVPSRIIGVGGMPIWNPRISKEIAISTSNHEVLNHEVFFIVGDFRFGNAVLKDPVFKASGRPEKVYLSIDKELINEENDRMMLDLCQSAIESLTQQLNGKLRLLFWDLSIREYQNRATGRYQDLGTYRHPVWNLHDVLGQFAGVAIDTQDILKVGERLYIDSSAHPSLVGWLYILKLLRRDERVDLIKTIQTFDHLLKRLLDKVFAKETVLITGDSKFARALHFFVQKGHFQLPAAWAISPLSRAIDGAAFDHCLFFPALCTYGLGEAEISEGVENVINIRQKLSVKHKRLSILYYDNWAYESISKRKDFLDKYHSKYTRGLSVNLELVTCPRNQAYKMSDSVDFEGMIELNNFLLPTPLGIFEIFCRSVADLSHEQVMALYSDFVSGCYS